MILLFKPDSVYRYQRIKTTVSKDDLLDYLSGENHKELSVIFREDTTEFLQSLTGMSKSSLGFYLTRMEEYFTTESKKVFNKIGLSHWSERVKIAMFMVVILVPIMIILVFATCALIFVIINYVLAFSHNREIKRLRSEEADLISKINAMRKD